MSKMDLAWRTDKTVYLPGKNMFEAEPALTICSDASSTGWGAVCSETSTGMTWTYKESSRHINVLELQVAFNALQAFTGWKNNSKIMLRLDNPTAVSYINRVGVLRIGRKEEQADRQRDTRRVRLSPKPGRTVGFGIESCVRSRI